MISCEIGTGTTYINIANGTGVVVPPADPVAWSVAMKALWDFPDICNKMGRKARLRVEEWRRQT